MGESLSLHDLGFAYGRGPRVLDRVTCTFHSRAIAVLGPNGAGKSTLLKILTTAVEPDEGTFAAGGFSRGTSVEELRAYRQRLGYMPQTLRILGGYSCAEFLRYVAWLREVDSGEVEANVEDALKAVNLYDRRDQRVKALSGGMQQRVGLAQAIVNRPRFLVLDEPTVGLDPRQRAEFRTYLAALPQETTILLATHLVDDVSAVADDVLILDGGSLAFAGSIQELCATTNERPTGQEVEAAYLKLLAGSS